MPNKRTSPKRPKGSIVTKDSRPFLHWAPYFLAALMVAIGQVLLFKHFVSTGFFLSIAGLLLLAGQALGIVDLNSMIPERPLKSGPGKKRASRPDRPKITYRLKKETFSVTGIMRVIFILAAIFLGIQGQINLADNGKRDIIGLSYYLAGVILFLAALWPWKREELTLAPLSPRIEWTAFGIIMALAAFLRIYKLDTIPSGIFFDMGFQGLGALKILHEGWRPWELNITESFPSAPVPIYIGALWFIFFKNTQFCLNLFYVTFCLASFPLIYWTFRQLSGPRVALLTIYILAVMRWNMNFSRNSFPPSLLPFFMFGTLALLLYGLRTRKKWPFIVAGILLPGGLYAYQTYVMFLVVIFLCGVYECVTNWKAVKANARFLAMFAAIFLILSAPFFYPMLKGTSNSRFNQLSIFAKCKREHSLEPIKINWKYTALMYNRRGDPNPRHNIQDHRQLDHVTGFLLFFGVFYGLARFCRRKYFYALSGFFVMALPCLITVDPAHSSRMHGQTAFVAFLAASVVAALWGRVRALWGIRGEIAFLVFMAFPLYAMGQQNFRDYFFGQGNNYSCWAEYSIAESTIGKRCAQYGDKYECYISPRYFSFYTVDFLTYFVRDHVHRLDLPPSPAILPPAGRGLYFALEEGRTGVLELLKSTYPGGEEELTRDPNGKAYVYFYRVPPEVVDKFRGLNGKFSNGIDAKQLKEFPGNLPAGPYQASLSGSFYVEKTGVYSFSIESPIAISWQIGGHPVFEGKRTRLAEGCYPFRMNLSAPPGPVNLRIRFTRDGETGDLKASQFSTLSYSRGLLGRYYHAMNWEGDPVVTRWDPVVNYVNGNDFNYQWGAPLAIHWEGVLNIPKTGPYTFMPQSLNAGRIEVDHRKIGSTGMGTGKVHLTEGPHAFDVYYSQSNGWWSNYSLVWIRPGEGNAEVIPNQYFGETH